MQQTTNYALKKIELTDSPPDITVINPNWDTIDEELKETADDLTAHLAEDVAHNRYGVATGTNALVATPSPVLTALKAGVSLRFKNTTANTGPVTLNANGLGAKPIVKNGGIALSSGNLKAGGVYSVLYDGTSFILQGEGGYGEGDKIPYAKLGFTEPPMLYLSKGNMKSANSSLIGRYEDTNYLYYVYSDNNTAIRLNRINKATGLVDKNVSSSNNSSWMPVRGQSPEGFVAYTAYAGCRIFNADLGVLANGGAFYEGGEFDSLSNLYISYSGSIIRWNRATTVTAWQRYGTEIAANYEFTGFTVMDDFIFVVNQLKTDRKIWRLERRATSSGAILAGKNFTQTVGYTLRVLGNDKKYIYITDGAYIYKYDFNLDLVSSTYNANVISIQGDYNANVLIVYSGYATQVNTIITLYNPVNMSIIKQFDLTTASSSYGTGAIIDALGDIYTLFLYGNTYDQRSIASRLAEELIIKG